MNYALKRKKLYWRFTIGYFGIFGSVMVALGFSLAQRAGWKPVLAGAPVYITFLIALTYQLIKELRALKREESAEKFQDESAP